MQSQRGIGCSYTDRQPTCLNDAAAQKAGLAGFLLQLSLHCTQLGKLRACLALEDMLLCLHTRQHSCTPIHTGNNKQLSAT